ncbi:hypothetical protein S-CBP42_0055 [Synechococcus phage S-CBP42]|uniref:SaV-like n=1 Tax=Synechococcus phage S-CBP42 TaxID=461711 RepID=A0A096VKW5_9CAUD|nr:nucleotide kinase [Synechococcus phage S-CBP42]AGK86705.1 hypothetical protein S-CBP42_0055 [Synechococcus phage S-CBP42]
MTNSKYSPDHYQLGRIQVWDFIVDQDLGFLEGNVIKYICRAGHKPHEDRIDDLLKAKTYIQKLIDTTHDYDSGLPRTSCQVQNSNDPTDRHFLPQYLEHPTPSDYRGVRRVR